MKLFKRTLPIQNTAYPRDKYKPVIRASICTGEKTACMQDIRSGKLTELALIRTEADMAEFCRQYGVKMEDIETVY